MKRIVPMILRHSPVVLLALSVFAGPAAQAVVMVETQDKRPAYETVVGEVASSDADAHTITVKTDQGATVVVKGIDRTVYSRVAAGQTTLEGATTIQFADVTTGDRVVIRGIFNDDRSFITATRVAASSKSDIDKKHQANLDDWRKRGIFGVVKSVDPQTKKISLEIRALAASTLVDVSLDKAELLRYSPQSLNFSEAKASDINAVKVGDQLRALGTRSADGKSYAAEKAISGSFQTIGVTVLEVDVQKNEMKVQTLDKKKTITLALNKESIIHRIPQQMAVGLARRLAPPDTPRPTPTGGAPAGQGGGQSQAAGAGQGGGQGAGQAASQGGGQSAGGGQGGGQGGGPGAGGPPRDIQQMIDSLPNLTLADIKAGDVLAVASSTGSDDTHITGIKLVAGMDAVMQAIQANQAGRKQQTVSLSSGLPAGFDFGVIQP